jgi:beta-glucanase (GH16 family)
MKHQPIPDRVQPNHNTLFFDDFGSELLDRSKWNVRITGSVYNNEQQAYIDSSETLYRANPEQAPGAQHGALVFQPLYRPGHVTSEGDRFDFVSGRIDTRDTFHFQYGSAAARIMLPTGIGLWPAFWLLGYQPWPDSGEIDIMEYVGEPDWVSAAAHGPGYSGEDGLVNKFFFPMETDATAWHVYSVVWTQDKLIFKVDDTVIYRVTRPMTEFFGSWVFNTNKFLILNFAIGGRYPFKTNGIRDPYYGLPDSTVKTIMSGRVRMVVDWVHVMKSAGI